MGVFPCYLNKTQFIERLQEDIKFGNYKLDKYAPEFLINNLPNKILNPKNKLEYSLIVDWTFMSHGYGFYNFHIGYHNESEAIWTHPYIKLSEALDEMFDILEHSNFEIIEK